MMIRLQLCKLVETGLKIMGCVMAEAVMEQSGQSKKILIFQVG